MLAQKVILKTYILTTQVAKCFLYNEFILAILVDISDESNPDL